MNIFVLEVTNLHRERVHIVFLCLEGERVGMCETVIQKHILCSCGSPSNNFPPDLSKFLDCGTEKEGLLLGVVRIKGRSYTAELTDGCRLCKGVCFSGTVVYLLINPSSCCSICSS